MAKIIILGPPNPDTRRLTEDLERHGYSPTVISAEEETLDHWEEPDLVLMNLAGGSFDIEKVKELLERCHQNPRTPVMAVLSEPQLHEYDLTIGFEDFLLYPYRPAELTTRVKQSLWRNGKGDVSSENIIKCRDLIIDTGNYEVFLAGEPVELTFKEYELLKFLATNQGKVFTREALLNRLWGYDYYGGDRTVDVHIRRLRSKIEDAHHSFVETVRNVGYRFR